MGKILISGASGLIGTRLTEMLQERGHHVSHLSRGKSSHSVTTFRWDIRKHFIQKGALENIDTIIHLAGAGIADEPWTENRKREIVESRTLSTRLLYQELKKGNHSVSSFISASGVGHYGFADNELHEETDPPGNDFLAQVVVKWEREADQIESLGIRVVKIRTGFVLSDKGGALAEIVKTVKLYVGAPLGDGNQYLSWIHIDDLCELYIAAVENTAYVGAYNGVGPYPVTNKALTKAIAKVLNKPIIIPAVPVFLLKMIFGQMADLVLTGIKVSAEKIQAIGFQYRYDTLEKALTHLLKRA